MAENEGYKGYLFKIHSTVYGDYTVTGQNYIKDESYKVSKKIQDLDSYRDGNGVLHRNALDNVPLKVVINTRENLTNTEIQSFWQEIRKRYTIPKERKISATFFVAEINGYVTQDLYVADPDFQIKTIKQGEVYYKSMQFSFIGY